MAPTTSNPLVQLVWGLACHYRQRRRTYRYRPCQCRRASRVFAPAECLASAAAVAVAEDWASECLVFAAVECRACRYRPCHYRFVATGRLSGVGNQAFVAGDCMAGAVAVGTGC